MSRINRYKFIKRMYPDYLIVFWTNSGYKYEGIDKDIMMNFCHNDYKLKWLQKKHINYLVMDNLEIVSKYDDKQNSYHKYFYLASFSNILSKYQ